MTDFSYCRAQIYGGQHFRHCRVETKGEHINLISETRFERYALEDYNGHTAVFGVCLTSAPMGPKNLTTDTNLLRR